MFQPCDIKTLQRLHDTANRTREMIHQRAIKAYCEAFGGSYKSGAHLDMCVIHNSIISFDQGNPWKEVNYSAMRRARWLCERSHEPSRIVNQWYQRKTRRA